MNDMLRSRVVTCIPRSRHIAIHRVHGIQRTKQVRFNSNYSWNNIPPEEPRSTWRFIMQHKIIVGSMLVMIPTIAYFEAKRRQAIRDLPKHNYPESVAKEMRKAIIYHHYKPDYTKAMANYDRAILALQEAGVDPTSDEALGIHAEYICLHENFDKPEKTLRQLKLISNFILSQLAQVKLFGIEIDATTTPASIKRTQPDTTAGQRDVKYDPRTSRLIKWFARFNYKAFDLVNRLESGEHVDARIEQWLDSAIMLGVSDYNARQHADIQDNQESLPARELGEMMERQSELYIQRNEPEAARQILLGACRMFPEDDCHIITLLNNLSALTLSSQTLTNPEKGAEVIMDHAFEVLKRIPNAEDCEECIISRGSLLAVKAAIAEANGDTVKAAQLNKEAEEYMFIHMKDGLVEKVDVSVKGRFGNLSRRES